MCVPSIAGKPVISCCLMTLAMLFVGFAAASAFCANPTVRAQGVSPAIVQMCYLGDASISLAALSTSDVATEHRGDPWLCIA